MPPLFAKFLTDESEYAQAETYWATIWDATPEFYRQSGGWRSGWFNAQPPKDGNPIFTAISEKDRKAIRVIQYEPTTDAPEIEFWMDTYGGTHVDPVAIRELVIACALSPESSQRALQLMSSWIIGDIELSTESPSGYGLLNIRGARPLWQRPITDPDAASSAPMPGQ
jgi:hypothetical protein